MSQTIHSQAVPLTVIVTVVDGGPTLERCLTATVVSARRVGAEVLVPLDRYCSDSRDLQARFLDCRFLELDRSPADPGSPTPRLEHELYDRRRAAGLAAARGDVIAITEDRAVPEPDWCQQLLLALAESDGVVGGAIENAINRPLNWAWYYCDFGRYGRPFPNARIEYLSDVNVAYRREVIESVRPVWERRYQESLVHWAMRDRGVQLKLDERPVVFQHRPTMSLIRALAERFEWGQVFGETRARRCSNLTRLGRVVGSPVVPLVLTARAAGHMRRHRRRLGQMAGALPLVLVLSAAWAAGEAAGLLRTGQARSAAARAGATVQPGPS